MKHALPSLDGLKVFEAAARLLSFSQAASELCVSKGAVSYQIRRLEEKLGWPLFRRATRQVYLTDQGQELYQAVQGALLDIERRIGEISRRRQQDVRIAATTYVAARWLSIRVARFLEHHPGASVRFDHDVEQPDFHSQNSDLCVRWDRMTGKLNQHRVMELPMALIAVCSQPLADDLVNDPDKIVGVNLLSEVRHQDLWIEWFEQPALSNPRLEIADANVRVQAAIDGQGLILADDLMRSEIDSGLLVAPFPRQLTGYGYAVEVYQPGSLGPLASQMLAWLIQTDVNQPNFEGDAGLFAGC